VAYPLYIGPHEQNWFCRQKFVFEKVLQF